MTILVDMDDTIEQLLRAWLKCANEKFDREVTYDEVRDWDVSKAYPGLTHDQIYDILLQPGFWKTVEPMPGAARVLKQFMEDGHKVYIVTATDYEIIPEKMDHLLFRYFPFLSWDQVIITSRKQMIKGDVLIDDGVHNLEGGDYAKILVTAPHNVDYDAEANGMIRVKDWDEILSAVEMLERNAEAAR